VTERPAKNLPEGDGDPKDLQPPFPGLDSVDHAILRLLAAHGRMPNNAIAERVGIAPSTCLGRIRALTERGAIRGYYADIDPAAVGRPIQAMIAVRLQPHARGHIDAFATRIAELPEVMDVYFLAGPMDFHIHVAATGTQNLRDFVVVNLNSHPDIAHTETSLIFEHVRGRSVQ
jgi:DNA-binding Lrp family transcriptional regulator